MVRLTADLIWKSPHFFNAIKERELDLRGTVSIFSALDSDLAYFLFVYKTIFDFTIGDKIAVIENLGATEVSYTSSLILDFRNAFEILHFTYLFVHLFFARTNLIQSICPIMKLSSLRTCLILIAWVL